ncbi:MAG: DNA repair protein RadA [Spirochaetaceae bacterium]|nr:DNA repair protein RadA [Spirochaetaceae bacterium]
MKKQRTVVYRCSGCGHEEPKWLGRCPECGEWNTLAEAAAAPKTGIGTGIGAAHPVPLSSVDSSEVARVGSGLPELDRVLGGGIMKRSTVLVGGEPGIGKSTLLLEMAAKARVKGRVLYVSGEESPGQIKMRADRLGLDTGRIELLCSGRLEQIETTLNSVRPVIVIIDSAQTLWSQDAGVVPGTVNQMKYCCFELVNWVKEHDAALFLVAHVTKEGVISGPKTIEHMVDTVLYFEQTVTDSSLSAAGDSRFLRAAKNRFGSVDEIGIFTIGENGLTPVDDPSRLFLVRREGALPAGVAVAAVLEGTRSFLVEIQALMIPAKGAASRVYSDRIDSGRVSRVAATVEKALQLRLSDQDLFVNIAGGIRINEVGIELALAAALYSARTGLPLPANTAIAGELSLAAEVRPVRRLPSRVKTAASLGFTAFVGPPGEDSAQTAGVKTLTEAVRMLYPK